MDASLKDEAAGYATQASRWQSLKYMMVLPWLRRAQLRHGEEAQEWAQVRLHHAALRHTDFTIQGQIA